MSFLHDMNYSEKLKSPLWQRKRLEVLNRDNFKCTCCGDEKTELHVHHLKYTKEPYDSPLEDLKTLCKICHFYFTFKFKEDLDIYNIKESDFNFIIKHEKCFIVSFFDADILYWYEGEKMELLCCFNKNSNVVVDLYRINRTE